MNTSRYSRSLLVIAILATGSATANAQLDSIPPEPDSTTATLPAASDENVKRALFTSGVVGHEPVDQLDSLTTTADRVFFFTEIVGYQGGTIVHRWLLDGNVVAEVPIDISGPRWRVYSSKSLETLSPGALKVQVLDGRNNVIAERTLVYYRGDQVPAASTSQ